MGLYERHILLLLSPLDWNLLAVLLIYLHPKHSSSTLQPQSLDNASSCTAHLDSYPASRAGFYSSRIRDLTILPHLRPRPPFLSAYHARVNPFFQNKPSGLSQKHGQKNEPYMEKGQERLY